MPDTAKRMARVPILGEDGRISDDYVPAAIGEGVESAEAAAKRAETAAVAAEGSATAAGQSATGAQGSASAAGKSADQARESAEAAGGAVTQAQSAQQAAEAAKTGAESARGSAQTAASQAQQSATAAAESAGQVADKFIASAQATTLEPGSQATASVEDQVLTLGIPRGDKGDKGDQGDKGDPGDVSAVTAAEGSDLSVSTDEGTVTIDDSALRARIAELENQAANVLTGTSTGLVAHGDDAYATKPRRLTVHGATRQNLWVNPSGMQNGVTTTENSDGSVSFSGITTADINNWVCQPAVSYILKPSVRYTLSMYGGTQIGIDLIQYDSDGAFISGGNVQLYQPGSITFTAQASVSYAKFIFVTRVPSGTTVSGTYRVMLNEGSTAQPWCPPGLNSVDELSIVTAGKNLLKFQDNLQPITRNGLTFTPNEDGTVVVNGTATANGTDYYIVGVSWTSRADANFPANDLVFSTNGIAKIFGYDSDGAQVIAAAVNNGQTQIAASKAQACAKMVVYLSYNRGNGESNKRVYVQLELGSTATDYEPPSVTTTPLPEVELRSLPNGTCDELVIKADGTCEVDRRTAQIMLDGGDEQTFVVYASVVHDGKYFNVQFDMPDNGDGVKFSPTSQVSDKFKVGNADETSNTVGVYMNASTHKTNARISVDGIETVEGMRTYLQSNPVTIVYVTANDSTEPQSPITLPTLPAPTVNVWADAEASGAGYAMDPDVELEYERDVTIAFNQLQAQVSATTVREATNG